MITNLLGTKLHLPSPPSRRVQRAHLMHVLTEGLEAGHPFVLISAPAGFGKTTLASEWVSNLHLPVAWLSLDRLDDDPGQFFSNLIVALQKINPNIGQEIDRVLRSGQIPPLPTIAASLVNDILTLDSHFVLVLDDFQVIQDQAILEVLEIILTNPPAQLHLVLITREDPPLPLSRLRANNKMTEVRAGDLRFLNHEVHQFLNEVMGLSLSESNVAVMGDRTEGWAAGLQLAAIAMHDRGDPSSFIAKLSGSHRYFLSYLTEEVLSRQSEEVQTFLLQTSILEKLCGELCDAVTTHTNSLALLEKCFRANLFLVPLDDEGHWYRYHHLFRDLLLTQGSRFPKQDILALHRRASHWYEGAGMISESIEHALLATDYQHAVHLFESHAQTMIMQGYLKTVEGWMQTLPSDWQSLNPRANLAFAWLYLLRGSYEKVSPYLERARQAIWDLDPADLASTSLRAEWLSLQATFLNVRGKVGQSIELANHALQQASDQDHYIKSLAYSALGGGFRLTGDYTRAIEAFQLAIQSGRAGEHFVPEMLAVGGLMSLLIQHGRLQQAYQVGSQALERIERQGVIYTPMAGAVHSSLGLICYEWNQLEQASRHLARGIQLSNLSGHNAGVVYAKVVLMRVLQAQGDLQAATQSFREAVDLLPSGLPAWLKPDVASYLARYYLSEGDPAAAYAVLKQLGISPSSSLLPSDLSSHPQALTHQEGLNVILALRFLVNRIQIGQGLEELQGGIDLAGNLITQALPFQRIEIVLQALLLRAQMLTIQDKTEASRADLLQAVELAEPEGYLRTFLDEGPSVVDLLGQALKKSSPLRAQHAGFIRQVLALSTASRPGIQPLSLRTPLHAEKLIEPLTDREIDVLRLMAEGLKYHEIADRLYITLNTVRFYVKEIYGKLCVNNRTQAIEAAHAHQLL